MSWQKVSQDYREAAISAVRDVVGAYRKLGRKSEDAIRTAAPELGLTTRRVKSLFYREDRLVLRDEWIQVRLRAANVLRRKATELRNLADEWDAQADALESAQFNFRDDTAWNARSGVALAQKQAA